MEYKSLCSASGNQQKEKCLQTGRKSLPLYIWQDWYLQYIKNSKEIYIPVNRQFSKDGVQMADKYMEKTCSVSSIWTGANETTLTLRVTLTR